MKKHIIIIITFFSSFLATAQEKNRAEDEISFDIALNYFDKEDNENALKSFTTFMLQYPNSNLKPRAKFNIGIILRKLNRNDEAAIVFSEILDSNYNEKESYGGIMEQYTLYKNRSAKQLAEIYLEKKEYKKAAEYIYLFDKKYKYSHFCANEMIADEIYIAESYATLFIGQNNPKEAIDKLLPYLFYNDLASNSRTLVLLEESLKMQYTEEQIKKVIKEALKSLTLQSEETARITLLEKRLTFSDNSLYDFSNPEIKANLELTGLEKFNKILATHPLLSKYLE